MIEVSNEFIEHYFNNSPRKNLRISFPYEKDMDDICNDKIVSESFTLDESVCSEDNLKFGLCESSGASFETIGIGGLKGKTIDISIDVEARYKMIVKSGSGEDSTNDDSLIWEVSNIDGKSGDILNFKLASTNGYELDCDNTDITFSYKGSVVKTYKTSDDIVVWSEADKTITKDYDKVVITVQSLHGKTSGSYDFNITRTVTIENAVYDSTLEKYLIKIPLGRFVVDSCDKNGKLLSDNDEIIYKYKIQTYSKTDDWNDNGCYRYAKYSRWINTTNTLHEISIPLDHLLEGITGIKKYSDIDDYEVKHLNSNLDDFTETILEAKANNSDYDTISIRLTGKRCTFEPINYIITSSRHQYGFVNTWFHKSTNYVHIDFDGVSEAFVDNVSQTYYECEESEIVDLLKNYDGGWVREYRPLSYYTSTTNPPANTEDGYIRDIPIEESDLYNSIDNYISHASMYWETHYTSGDTSTKYQTKSTIGAMYPYKTEVVLTKTDGTEEVIYTSMHSCITFEAIYSESYYIWQNTEKVYFWYTDTGVQFHRKTKDTITFMRDTTITTQMKSGTRTDKTSTSSYFYNNDESTFVSNWLELNCKFGRYGRDGKFYTLDISESESEFISPKHYFDLYAKDYQTQKIKNITLDGENEWDNRLKYRKGTYRVYDLSSNGIDNSNVLYDFSDKLKEFPTYTPVELDMIAMPWLEPGDKISILTDEGYIDSFVLSRNMSGIQRLIDSLEAK